MTLPQAASSFFLPRLCIWFYRQTQLVAWTIMDDPFEAVAGDDDSWKLPPEQLQQLLDQQQLPPRFQVLEALGAGGQALVFRARDRELQRDVALKCLRLAPGDSRQAAWQRLERKARLLAEFQHPGILPVYDILPLGDQLLMVVVMALAPGPSLAVHLERATEQGWNRGLYSLGERVLGLRRICDILAYAHAAGIVHNDISPGNILIGEYGETVLVNWGAATTAEQRAAGEVPAVVTKRFSAPEQWQGQADSRSDIYSLGLVLRQVLRDQKRLPPALAAINHRATALDPKQRYQSIRALADDLAAWLAGEAPTVYREPWWRRAGRWLHRHRRAMQLALMVILALVSLVALSLRHYLQEIAGWQLVRSGPFTAAELRDDWSLVFLPGWAADRQFTIDNQDDRIRLVDDQLILDTEAIHFGCYNLIWKQHIGNRVRLSWDVTADTGRDLNVFLAGENRSTGYCLHVAGNNEPRRISLTRPGDQQGILTVHTVVLDQAIQAHRQYHCQIVLDDDRLRLRLNGRTVLDYQDPFPLRGPAHRQLGFEFSSSDLIIDNVVIERRGTPERTTPLVAAASLEQAGALADAQREYQFQARDLGDSDSGRLAAFHAARLRLMHGEPKAALPDLLDIARQGSGALSHRARLMAIRCQLALASRPEALATANSIPASSWSRAWRRQALSLLNQTQLAEAKRLAWSDDPQHIRQQALAIIDEQLTWRAQLDLLDEPVPANEGQSLAVAGRELLRLFEPTTLREQLGSMQAELVDALLKNGDYLPQTIDSADLVLDALEQTTLAIWRRDEQQIAHARRLLTQGMQAVPDSRAIPALQQLLDGRADHVDPRQVEPRLLLPLALTRDNFDLYYDNADAISESRGLLLQQRYQDLIDQSVRPDLLAKAQLGTALQAALDGRRTDATNIATTIMATPPTSISREELPAWLLFAPLLAAADDPTQSRDLIRHQRQRYPTTPPRYWQRWADQIDALLAGDDATADIDRHPLLPGLLAEFKGDLSGAKQCYRDCEAALLPWESVERDFLAWRLLVISAEP